MKKNNNHKRGFASLDKETRSKISSQGGKAAHALGRAHEWNSKEARIAGKKGNSVRNKKH